MEKEQAQVEQEPKINPELEEKIDTSKLDDTFSETQKPSSEVNVSIVNFITKPTKTIQTLLTKDDLFKKKIIKTSLLLLSLCMAIYYYVAISTIPNTVWWGKIILTIVLVFFYRCYLYVDALGVWCGSKILG
jgi:hypothetical protein